MKTDRELLEQAALAANEELKYDSFGPSENADRVYCYWNPLDNDGDAFRLAVKLHINVHFIWDGENDQYDPVYASRGQVHFEEKIGITIKEEFDEYAATRRAIVRAAAAIGQSMKEQGK